MYTSLTDALAKFELDLNNISATTTDGTNSLVIEKTVLTALIKCETEDKWKY